MPPNPVVRAVATAAVVTTVADRVFSSSPAFGPDAWQRTNCRGRSVSLTGGAATATGAILGAVVTAPRGWRAAALLAGGSAAVAGAYDDLVAPSRELSTDKGWRGHLRAIRSGRVSGGVVKVTVIGAGSLLAAAATPGRSRARLIPDAALIAVSANLLNLFDLRPGRAGKVTVAAASGVLGGPLAPVAAAVLGAAAAELPGDLGERRMLGDLGANTLGALLGLRLIAASMPVRTATLAVAVGLTALSERVSFSAVIQANPMLRRIDGWGRLAAPVATPAANEL